MTDIFEQASERETLERELAIKNRLANPVPSYGYAKGACLNCGEGFEPGSLKLYCNGKCADQHGQRQSARRF
jgi:hypothetical protein